MTNCTTSNDCPAGQVCDSENGICIFNGGLSICSSNTDCRSGGSCDGTCVQFATGLGFCSYVGCDQCTTDSDCFPQQDACRANPHCVNKVCTYEATNLPGCEPLQIDGCSVFLLPTKLDPGCAQTAKVFSGISVNSPGLLTPDRVKIDTTTATTHAQDFSDDAFQDALDYFQLPPEDKIRLAIWERDATRVFLLNRLVSVFKYTNNDTDGLERPYNGPVRDAYAKLIHNYRKAAALRAVQEYDKWDPPGAVLPSGDCVTGIKSDGSATNPRICDADGLNCVDVCYGVVSGQYPSCDLMDASAPPGYRPPALLDPPAGYNWPPPNGTGYCPDGLFGVYLGAPSIDSFKAYGLVSATQDINKSAEFMVSQGEMASVMITGIALNTLSNGAELGSYFGPVLATMASAFAAVALVGLGIATAVGFSGGAVFLGAVPAFLGGVVSLAALPFVVIIGSVMSTILFFVSYDDNLQIRPTLVTNYNSIAQNNVTEDADIEFIKGALLSNFGDVQMWEQLRMVFLDSTLPSVVTDKSIAPIPARSDSDPKFLVYDETNNLIGESEAISYLAPDQLLDSNSDTHASVRLNGGWFIPNLWVQNVADSTQKVQKEQLRLRITYTDWGGRRITAWRQGNGFLTLNATNLSGIPADWTDRVAQTNTLHYLDHNGNKRQAQIATTTPPTPVTITSGFSGTLGTNGWYTSAVQIDFTCGGGVAPTTCNPVTMTLSSDGEDQSATSTATDAMGNTATTTAGPFNIDQTPPVLSVSLSPAANENGWNKTDVTVSPTCSDALSGISLSTPCPSGTETFSNEGEVFYTRAAVQDVAGNFSAALNLSIKIDKTPPTAVGSTNVQPNAAGWYNSDVTISYLCDDDLSGIDVCPGQITVLNESGPLFWETIVGVATDKAGNLGSSPSIAAKLDKTAPSINLSKTPTANANGWNNSAVTVKAQCSDATSGVKTCPSEQTVLTEGENQSVSLTAVDNADNSAAASIMVSLDATAPAITSILSPAPNTNGWNNTDVTLSYTCSDELSGIDPAFPCPAPSTFTSDDSATQLGHVQDKAGNASAANTTVKVDKTAPSINIVTPAASASYVQSQEVASSWTTVDATSGIDTATGTVPSGANIPTGIEGTFSFTVNATDKAGNSFAKSVTYTVLSPTQAITTLKTTTISVISKPNTYTKTLDAAQSQLQKGQYGAAINTMNLYIQQVNAQTGKTITQANATILINYARLIIAGIQTYL